MKELEDLERLANAATEGPWESITAELGGSGVIATNPMRGRIDSKITGMNRKDAEYIAAASPDVTLSLIRELRITRRALNRAAYDARGIEDAYIVAAGLELYPETEQP